MVEMNVVCFGGIKVFIEWVVKGNFRHREQEKQMVAVIF